MRSTLNRLCILLLTIMLAYCPASAEDEAIEMGDAGLFRPVDCGLPALDSYDFPFIGLNLTLPAEMLSRMNSRDVFVFPLEDYTVSGDIAYALLRFSAPDQAEKAAEGFSVDIFAWEEAMAKIGAIGIYRRGMADQLDALTLCDRHLKVGESPDGVYEYYLSTASNADPEAVALLEQAEMTISDMHKLDMALGYTAFSTDRIDGVTTVGAFVTNDVFGEEYTEAVFAEYDLTLVNVFTTWCGPCTKELPELEKLRATCAEKGIRLGVVAVVMDARTHQGVDEAAVADARQLAESSGAQFPFLIPDEGGMNGRLTGVATFPESFFVDGDGNIVSEPYIGANDLDGWRGIVDAMLYPMGN